MPALKKSKACQQSAFRLRIDRVNTKLHKGNCNYSSNNNNHNLAIGVSVITMFRPKETKVEVQVKLPSDKANHSEDPHLVHLQIQLISIINTSSVSITLLVLLTTVDSIKTTSRQELRLKPNHKLCRLN